MTAGVVVVSGLPATGKSTLASRLADDLGWAWVCRDRLSADLLGALGERRLDSSGEEVVQAKDRLVRAVADAGQRARGACDECGFDWEAGPDQLRRELRTLAPGVGACLTRFLEGEDPDVVLRARPAPDVWSAIEYAAHLRDVVAFYGERMRQIVEQDRPVLVVSAPFAQRSAYQRERDADPDEVLTALVQEADTASQLLDGLDQLGWWRLGVGSDGDRTLVSLARRLAHESHHHQLDLGRVLRAVRGR